VPCLRLCTAPNTVLYFPLNHKLKHMKLLFYHLQEYKLKVLTIRGCYRKYLGQREIWSTEELLL
jgi:hypothetical protein